jgi:hypothetical protein
MSLGYPMLMLKVQMPRLTWSFSHDQQRVALHKQHIIAMKE